MIRIEIPTIINFEDIRKEWIDANNAAIVPAAAKTVGPLRAAEPRKTGRLASQVGIRYFKQKTGLVGASVRVLGDRYFVSRILENGSKFIKARHTAERVTEAIASQIESVYTAEFFRQLDKTNK